MPRPRRKTRTSEHRKLVREHRKHYEELLAFQGGHCAICPKVPVPGARRFALDHDHKTMELRGILCTSCNLRLSGRHTVEWLEASVLYLKNPPWREMKEHA